MKSDTINELAAALALAQGAMESAKFDRANPFYKSKYATLASIWDSIRQPLSDNGLAVTQVVTGEADALQLVTLLIHSSGQWIGSTYPLFRKDDSPQSLGSATTYARRYSLSALVGAVSEDDDDGEAAAEKPVQAPAAKQRQQAPTPAQLTPPGQQQVTQQAPAGWTPPANGHEAEPTPDEVFDAMPSASENAKTPHATEAQKKPMHWSQDKVLMGQWWGWVKKPMGLDETDVHMLAEVEHLIDYPGTKEELSMLVREESKRRAMQRQSMAGLQGKKELT